ncbi:hypothetical protein AMTRI_Chr13g88160 [Amborella trichopoda]
MKKKLREQFLPFNNTQTMFQRLHTLWQSGWFVDNYTEEFYQLVAQNNLSETEEQQVVRYIVGLCQSIEDVLTYQRALTIEKQRSRGRSSTTRRGYSGLFQDHDARFDDSPSGGLRDIIGSNSTLCCFKCGEAGHKVGACRKPNSHDVDGYDGDPIYDEEPYEDDLIYGDVREPLVIRKNLLIAK